MLRLSVKNLKQGMIIAQSIYNRRGACYLVKGQPITNEYIRQLEKWGIQVIQANYRSEKYMQDLTRLINEHIDSCSGLFYDWINWDYIRNLFYVPKYNKPNVMKEEFTKYMANIEYYPFQQYII